MFRFHIPPISTYYNLLFTVIPSFPYRHQNNFTNNSSRLSMVCVIVLELDRSLIVLILNLIKFLLETRVSPIEPGSLNHRFNWVRNDCLSGFPIHFSGMEIYVYLYTYMYIYPRLTINIEHQSNRILVVSVHPVYKKKACISVGRCSTMRRLCFLCIFIKHKTH